jgi:hypothetical protein
LCVCQQRTCLKTQKGLRPRPLLPSGEELPGGCCVWDGLRPDVPVGDVQGRGRVMQVPVMTGGSEHCKGASAGCPLANPFPIHHTNWYLQPWDGTSGHLAQHSTSQHIISQHSTAQHSTARRGTAQPSSTAQHSTVRHSTAQHSTARVQHGIAWHGTPQHHTERHCTARHSNAHNIRLVLSCTQSCDDNCLPVTLGRCSCDTARTHGRLARECAGVCSCG